MKRTSSILTLAFLTLTLLPLDAFAAQMRRYTAPVQIEKAGVQRFVTPVGAQRRTRVPKRRPSTGSKQQPPKPPSSRGDDVPPAPPKDDGQHPPKPDNSDGAPERAPLAESF